MGFFGKKKVTVRVKGGDPTQPPPVYDPAKSNFPGYCYRWEIRDTPQVGQWVVVPGLEGDWVGAIVGIDPKPSKDATKSVKRVATAADIRRQIKRDGGS